MDRKIYTNTFMGMSDEVFGKLGSFGIQTMDELITKLSDPHVRRDVSQKTGVTELQLVQWTNAAELMRVGGVTREYSELLSAVGVTSLDQLSGQKPEDLVHKLEQMNSTRKLVEAAPKLPEVQRWIDESKKIGTKVAV